MTMRALSLALAAAAAAVVATTDAESPIDRRLELTDICRYSPDTKVTDENALDLDQEKIRDRLSLGQIVHARQVYEYGGYSQSTAKLTLLSPPGPFSFSAGTRVYGPTHATTNGAAGESAFGLLKEGVTWENNSANGIRNNHTVQVEYSVSEVQSLYTNCHVGALSSFEQAMLDGCFADAGLVEFVEEGKNQGEGVKFNYSYSVRHDNINYRTLQSLSLKTPETMKSCATCEYHSDFQKFVDYYGDTDYADKWIKAASYELSTEFSSGRGNANFTGLQKIGVAEAMLAGTVYLNLFMHVIHEVEMAAAACDGACQPGLTCVEEPVHALDRAVAFYCGSLEGEHGSGEGVFQFAIANHRGKDFRTAGETRNKTSGEANANQDLISQFNRAKLSLNRKNCDAVLQHRIDIINLLKVPVIQALLRMAYIRDFEDLSDDLLDKAEGAGATFAAAILPFVHACNAADAEIVYQNMKIGATDSQVSFSSVKSALERNYECMGVTCTDIGGLWEEDKYADGAEPCTHIVSSDSSPSVAANSDKATDAGGDQGKSAGGKAATWIMVLTVLGLMAGFVAYRRVVVRKRRNIEKNFRASSSNIAAVSEIA